MILLAKCDEKAVQLFLTIVRCLCFTHGHFNTNCAAVSELCTQIDKSVIIVLNYNQINSIDSKFHICVSEVLYLLCLQSTCCTMSSRMMLMLLTVRINMKMEKKRTFLNTTAILVSISPKEVLQRMGIL